MRFFILVLVFSLFSLGAVAQSTSPRFGTTSKGNQSSSVLNNSLTTVTDTTGADSTTLSVKAYNSLVKVALVDSFYLKSPVVTGSYLGDNMTIIVSGTSGNKLKFAGTNFISAGTATLSSGARAVIKFVFDGAKWVEASRVVQ